MNFIPPKTNFSLHNKGLASDGLSLIEILLAISIASLLAVLLIPKTLTATSKVQSNRISACEQTMAQLESAVQSFQQQTGLSVQPDVSNQNYNYVLYNFGSYFIYKTFTDKSGSTVSYYQYADGSRISLTPQIFLPTSTNPIVNNIAGGVADYANSTLKTTTWAAVAAPSTAAWCGDYNPNTCVYLDYNGSAPPNTIGSGGDIIPFHIDTTSGHIRSLYQAEKQDNPTAAASSLCRFASIYDFETNAADPSCT